MEKGDGYNCSPSFKPLSALGTQMKDVRPFWLALRSQWEQIFGICLALFVFCVYSWTRCSSIFPGESAFACVNVLQAWPGHDFIGHPLANSAARLFSYIPIGELPTRLNMFSALCGAGVAFYLFKLVTIILYDAMSEVRWFYPVNEDTLSDERSTLDAVHSRDAIDEINDSAHRIAMAGGAISALLFAFCTPFWLASTRFHYQTFEVLLIVTTCYLLVHYWVMASVRSLMVAAVLIGVGMVEATFFVFLLPCAVFCFIIGGYRHGHLSTSFIALLMLYTATGMLIAGVVQVLWLISSGGTMSTQVVVKIASLWWQNQLNGMLSIVERRGWLIMLAEGLIPFLLAFAARYPIAYAYFLSPKSRGTVTQEHTNWHEEQDILSGFSWSIAVFILLGCVAHVALNLPGSPWALARAGTHLPIMPFLGNAITGGFLFAYGLLFGYQHLARRATLVQTSRIRRFFSMGSLMRISVVTMILLLMVTALFRNQKEIDGNKATFVDVICREILAAAPQAHCFVTEGALDMNLLVQAWMQKRTISLIHSQDVTQRPVLDLKGTPKKTATAFLVEWLANHPDAYTQVAMLDAPRLWFDAGLQAVPTTLVYLGSKPGTDLDVKALLNRQQAFWKRNKALFIGVDPRLMALRRLQVEIRMQISRVANDLGVFCLHREAEEDARTAFEFALEVDRNNFSAWVNHTAYQLDRAQTEKKQSVDQCLEKVMMLMEKMPTCASLAESEKHYGSLYLPAVEHLATLCIGRASPRVVQKVSPLIAQLRDYVQGVMHVHARGPVASQASYRDGLTDEEMTKVIEAMTGGYWKAAETQLRTILRTKRTSLVAWSLLAEVLMNLKNYAEVTSTVIPEMRTVAGPAGSEWVDMTEGCCALRQPKPDHRMAHDHFLRALKRNPNIEEAQNMLIQTALFLGDQALIETDCTTVLTHTRQHPMANAVLGTLRLNQNRLEEAEKVLNISIAAQPSASALNDLGETLRRMQRLQAAERMARRALLLNPAFYQAWDTLALILMDQGRLEEASEAHRSALCYCQTDIRLFLNAAKLEQARGDYKTARTLLQKSSPLLAHAAASYKERYATLLKSLPHD